jgi:hypothetical protein
MAEGRRSGRRQLESRQNCRKKKLEKQYDATAEDTRTLPSEVRQVCTIRAVPRSGVWVCTTAVAPVLRYPEELMSKKAGAILRKPQVFGGLFGAPGARRLQSTVKNGELTVSPLVVI